MRSQQREEGSDFGADLAEKMISEQDADGDGALSLDETKLSEDAFNELDTDGDGLVSEEELATGLQASLEQMLQIMQASGMTQPEPPEGAPDAGQVADDAVSQLDEDGDGGLSQAESGVSSETFDALDLNEDGVVSAEELAEAMKNGVSGLESLFQQMQQPDEAQQGQMRRAAMAYQENMSDLMSTLFETGTTSSSTDAADESVLGMTAASLLQETLDLTI
jgi:Ca2+-binding EF-hand superfamily protein